ncbi:MAG TPA: rhodanese-like domain-containing protein [Bacteroidales bacterium]|nr:rhodanese-like domain-containing protein [Bacteroidales bacterium]
MKIKALIAIVTLFISTFATLTAQSPIESNSMEVSTMLKKDKKLVVLDVRTAGEFQAGHVKGAVNIDVTQQGALEKINKLDRKARYIVYCRTSRRSKIATDHMVQNGFKTVYQMMDGFSGWTANNLEVVK